MRISKFEYRSVPCEGKAPMGFGAQYAQALVKLISKLRGFAVRSKQAVSVEQNMHPFIAGWELDENYAVGDQWETGLELQEKRGCAAWQRSPAETKRVDFSSRGKPSTVSRSRSQAGVTRVQRLY